MIACVLTHRTQTNEPARCATLLPLLALLPQPLALVEVGASAGLCLLIDSYGYDYHGHRITPPEACAVAPVFPCSASADTPLPDAGVQVSWRAGLDLEPLDLANPHDVAWLEALVWPGEGQRLQQLRRAIALAREDPPRIAQGDLRYDLPALLAEAPRDATVVVFHSAVLAYLSDCQDRVDFGAMVLEHGARWVANEDSDILCASGASNEAWPTGRFLLTLDRQPIAWADSHGASLEWLG